MGRDAKEVKVLLMLPFTRKAPAPPSPKSKESVTLRVETEARCMSECVKLGLAVWLWASPFPCLGLSDLLGYMGTIIAVLPNFQGGCEGPKQCWADFWVLAFRGT